MRAYYVTFEKDYVKKINKDKYRHDLIRLD